MENAGHFNAWAEPGEVEQTVYAIYAETWYGVNLVETAYYNVTTDRERAESQLDRFQSQSTTIFKKGKFEGKRGVWLNARVVSRTFTISATEWAEPLRMGGWR